ncbi:MAG: helicase, partial [Arthrobacter sp.]|nr:helicase [Arthrobacter sp.]
GVLVFGPNRRFLSYISGVLPSLGENDVHLATMSDLLSVDATHAEPDHVARLKGDAALADALAHRVRQHQPHGVPLTLRAGADTVVLDAAQVDMARRQALDGGVGHNQGRDLFIEYIVDAVIHELEIRTAKEESEFEEELQSLLGIDLDRFTGTAGQVNADGAGRDMEIDWDLVRDDLLEDPVIDRTISQVWPRLDAGEVLRGLLSDSAALARAVPLVDHADIPTLSISASEPWSQADLALLDEARALVDGPPEQTFGHIVVDEAQQLSPMQWRTLMRRCPGRSMTIVGDLAQAGPTTPPAQAWSDVLAPFVGERFSHHRLSVNYRTTAEILQSTEHLLATIAPDQHLSRSLRHGESPQTVVTAAHHLRQTLGTLTTEVQSKHPGELIGIICSADHAQRLAKYATELNVTVVPAPEARGLEFDTAIILDPDRIQRASDAGLRDLYVAQTRATKRLISVRIDEPSL